MPRPPPQTDAPQLASTVSSATACIGTRETTATGSIRLVQCLLALLRDMPTSHSHPSATPTRFAYRQFVRIPLCPMRIHYRLEDRECNGRRKTARALTRRAAGFRRGVAQFSSCLLRRNYAARAMLKGISLQEEVPSTSAKRFGRGGCLHRST